MILGRDASLRRGLVLQVVCTLLHRVQAVQSTGNVGCLFSQHVCLEEEQCFDDLIVGRCISPEGEDEEDIQGMGPLSGPPLHLLASEMRRVFSQGYVWEDDYSQCVFQTLLDHIKNKELYSLSECSHLVGRPEETPNVYQDYQHNQHTFDNSDTQNSLENQDNLDNLYYSQYNDDSLEGQLGSPDGENPDPYSESADGDSDPYSSSVDGLEPFPDSEEMPNIPVRKPEILFIPEDYLRLREQRSRNFLPEEDQSPSRPLSGFQLSEDDFSQDIPEIIPIFVSEDDVVDSHYVPEPTNDDDDVSETFQQLQDVADQVKNRRQRTKRPSNDWMILEQPEEKTQSYDFDYNDSAAPQEGDNDDAVYYSDEARFPVETIFDRRERLDVKKPGPFYANSQNNFFLDKLLELEADEETDLNSSEDLGQSEYETPLTMQKKHKKATQVAEKGPVLGIEEAPSKHSYLVVDIKDRFKTLGQAMSVVDTIAGHLDVPAQTFGQPRLWTSRMSIPVQSNPKQLNAADMAKVLGADLENVNKRMESSSGVEVHSFSAGSEKEVVSVYTGHSRLFLALFLLSAGLASVLVVGGLVLILRRRRNKKVVNKDEKENKDEPVKEYKQLVRDWSRSSRASQSSGAGPAGGVTEDAAAVSRTISEDGPKKPLSKHHNSEGSRASSTSSWQEEPGVTTMDISTGHMVLAYMEDHLTNKQRLEQEWVGLCAYEAEPAATSVAFKVENKKKNRYPDKLPYDHNRVLLNPILNGNNSDYINASTVTDHDPRNPAYIVTQGPMAHTIADFWQMVWEQGSVVIVMLSRLAENGYQLAHRYWPEEGSQQFHIYEVHLVSEHVWCEDYLVRSLYLKNTQTGETRTVTQFHFLSWSDGAIPDQPKSLLEFRRKVNKSYRGRSCPIIVHCSDGVGRSGAYVLLDMVLNRMNKGSKEIDIAATLEHIRDQRSGMVQTRSQFEFCLTSVAEETHAILKSLSQ